MAGPPPRAAAVTAFTAVVPQSARVWQSEQPVVGILDPLVVKYALGEDCRAWGKTVSHTVTQADLELAAIPQPPS